MWGDYDDGKIRSRGYDVGTDRRVYGIFYAAGLCHGRDWFYQS